MNIMSSESSKGQIMIGIASLEGQRIMFDHTKHMMAVGPINTQFDLLKTSSVMFKKFMGSDRSTKSEWEEEKQNDGFIYDYYEDTRTGSIGLMDKQFSVFVRIGISIIIFGVGLIVFIRVRVVMDTLWLCYQTVFGNK